LPFASVGATIINILAAVLANGSATLTIKSYTVHFYISSNNSNEPVNMNGNSYQRNKL